MDGNRFDNLSRALTRGLSRRGALKALVGATAIGTIDEAGAAACMGIGASCASRRCCQRLTCDAGTRKCLGLETARGCGTNSALCRAPFVCQSNMCVVPARTIGQTCQIRGAKNRRCGDGLVCFSGRCLGLLDATGCDGDNVLCNGELVCRVDTCLPLGELSETCDEDDDCAGDLVCTSGACSPDCTPDCTGLLCGDDGCGGSCGSCPGSESCCNGSCIDTDSDTANCGSCGTGCPSGDSCCSGICADFDTSEDHCGACGAACDAGEICSSGECLCGGVACDVGKTCCSDTCVDLTSNRDYCGACDTYCQFTEYCSDSVCFAYCDGNEGTRRITVEGRYVSGLYENAAYYNMPESQFASGSVYCMSSDDCTKCADLIGTTVSSYADSATVTDCGCAQGICNDEIFRDDRNAGTCKIFHQNPYF